MNRKPTRIHKQAGMTLIEAIVVITLGALAIGGALSLYNNASAGQHASQMVSDSSAIRASVKSLYANNGGYGVGSLNSVLINSNKVPTSMSVSGTTITHQLNGTVTVTGATTTFTAAFTNIPTDVCTNLLSASSGYSQIVVGANAAITTFPVSPATASTQCSAAALQTVTFTAS